MLMSLTATVVSSAEKDSESEPGTGVALALRREVSAFKARLTGLSTLVCRPFAMSLEALATALTGQGWVLFARSVRRLKDRSCNTSSM